MRLGLGARPRRVMRPALRTAVRGAITTLHGGLACIAHRASSPVRTHASHRPQRIDRPVPRCMGGTLTCIVVRGLLFGGGPVPSPLRCLRLERLGLRPEGGATRVCCSEFLLVSYAEMSPANAGRGLALFAPRSRPPQAAQRRPDKASSWRTPAPSLGLFGERK